MTAETPYGPRGARLWAAFVARDASLAESSNPLSAVAVSACRAADRVDALEELAAVTPAVVTLHGNVSMHPVFAEVRHQSALLARLIAALRLPDPATGRRPQTRPVRGVYAPSAVSSLERARQRAMEE